MKSIGWVVHGRLEKDRRWKGIQSKVERSAHHAHVVVFTQYSGHAAALAKQLCRSGCVAIVAVGGDGTLNECVNGVLPNYTNVAIGILAMGTGNDFVKTLHLSGNVDEILEAIEKDHYQQVDVALASYTNKLGENASRYCVNVMDIGIGGEVVQRIAHSSRWWGPFITYQKAILATLLKLKRPMVAWSKDQEKYEEKTLMLAIANAKWFGSGLGIAPLADVQDGVLEIVHLGDISILDYFLQLPHLRKGRHLRHPEIRYDRAQSLAVTTPDLPIDCDGEFIGATPMVVKICPGLLKILKP
jgi:diacylglycerol kinase (ATP)